MRTPEVRQRVAMLCIRKRVETEAMSSQPNRYRVARALTGRYGGDVARQAGVSPWRLSRIERGHVVPREDEIERLAKALSVDASWLADGSGRGPAALSRTSR